MKNDNIYDDDGREMGVLYPYTFSPEVPDLAALLKKLRQEHDQQQSRAKADHHGSIQD